MMMMLLLRFFRSYYLGKTKGIDKGCGITVALLFFTFFFYFLFFEGRGDCKDCMVLDGFYFCFVMCGVDKLCS